MVRGRRRGRLPGARAAVRWLAADARDVACIQGSSTGPAVAVQADVAVATVAGGLERWQRRVERRRLLAVGRRAALVGIAAACLLQLVALARGNDGSGLWLLPAGVLAATCLALGVAHRTSPAAVARLLDRDLDLGAGVSTAFELEATTERAAGRRGLGALVVADVRSALGRSLPGARARLRPHRREAVLLPALAAALAVALLVPSPRSDAAAGAVAAGQANQVNRALRADSGVPGAAAEAGGSPQSLAQTPLDAPPLAAVPTGGTTRAGGAASGRGAGDAGRATDSQAGAGKLSPTVGPGAGVAPTDGDGSSASGRRSVASDPAAGQPGGRADGRPNASAGGPADRSAAVKPAGAGGDADSAAAAGARKTAPGTAGRPPSEGTSKVGGKAGETAGKAPGGKGASAAGTAPGRKPRGSVPGGAASGAAPGSKSASQGVVPQLPGGSTRLPLAPAYRAVPGSGSGGAMSQSPNAGGAGGAGVSRQAQGSRDGSGAAGVAWVPPGGATVASTDRGVVRGYFASSARVSPGDW